MRCEAIRVTKTQQSFGDFEHAGWSDEQLCETYHERFAHLTQQSVPSLLDAARARPGSAVLDVATGAGYAAEAARERGAAATGIDFSAAQVELARETFSDIDFQIGDARNLEFEDATFDGVISNFGILHFPEPERFLAEAFRVLRTGGSIAFTAWEAPLRPSGFSIVLDALNSHGNLDVGLPHGPDFFQFADPEYCQNALSGCGFDSIYTTTLDLVWELEGPDGLFEAVLNATVRTAAVLRRQSDDARASIEAAIASGVHKFSQGDRFLVPMPVSLTRGSRP